MTAKSTSGCNQRIDNEVTDPASSNCLADADDCGDSGIEQATCTSGDTLVASAEPNSDHQKTSDREEADVCIVYNDFNMVSELISGAVCFTEWHNIVQATQRSPALTGPVAVSRPTGPGCEIIGKFISFPPHKHEHSRQKQLKINARDNSWSHSVSSSIQRQTRHPIRWSADILKMRSIST